LKINFGLGRSNGPRAGTGKILKFRPGQICLTFLHDTASVHVFPQLRRSFMAQDAVISVPKRPTCLQIHEDSGATAKFRFNLERNNVSFISAVQNPDTKFIAHYPMGVFRFISALLVYFTRLQSTKHELPS
jgi:hypothetical protein